MISFVICWKGGNYECSAFFLAIIDNSDGSDGIGRFLGLSMDIMLILSIYFAILILILPFLRKYFSARACATMWLLPIFIFWQAQMIFAEAPMPLYVLYIPENVLKTFIYIWVIGFVIIFGRSIISHILFRHKVMRVSKEVTDLTVLAIWNHELMRVEYNRPVRLVYSSFATVPFSMGRTKSGRVTVLPERSFTDEELLFIFRHETCHIQRLDVDTKIFLAFCGALCWFNPLVWIAIRKASDDLELSCDEIVLNGMDTEQRRRYAELLLNTAGHAGGFTTCLSSAARTMRYRLKNVVTERRRQTGTFLIAIAMFCCVMSYGLIAISSHRGSIAEVVYDADVVSSDIESVQYRGESHRDSGDVWAWDEEGLFDYISNLQVEELNSVNTLSAGGEKSLVMWMRINGKLTLVDLDDSKLRVWDLKHNEGKDYILRSVIDWDVLKGYLDLEAEKPENAMTIEDPQLWLDFDEPASEGPMNALCQSLEVLDAKNDEMVRSFQISHAPGGIFGNILATKVELIFDMPLVHMEVIVSNWYNTKEKQLEPELSEDGYFIQLEPYSAHYTIHAEFADRNDLCYEATYVFDVKYE